MSGTLTAEQVSKAVYAHSIHADCADADWQAIADELNATLGSDEPPYDELLRCLENDWHISASWDGLRKFWCIELTEEGVRMRDAAHGTLTADDVLNAVYNHGARWQAIADELNAELGSGECKITTSATDGLCSDDPKVYYELSCGHRMMLYGLDVLVRCAVCGKVVKR